MKGLTIAGLLFGGIFVALVPVAHALYGQAYPADRARRQALASCTRADPDFDRLNAVARAACYRQFLDLPPDPADPTRRGREAGRTMLPG